MLGRLDGEAVELSRIAKKRDVCPVLTGLLPRRPSSNE